MIELYLSQNKNSKSAAYGKYYPRVSYKQTLNIHDMAVHMAEHNTPFSEGTIEGILRDFVKCTREQTLMGNTPAVGSLKLLAQATGEYTREELNKDGRLSWTDKAAEEILSAKGGSTNAPSGSLTPDPSPTGEGSGNSGGDNGGGGDDAPNEN